MRSILILLVLLVGFTGCVRKHKVPVAQNAVASGMHEVKVDDVIQTTNYTYLKVSENGAENWIAVTKMDASKGDTYYYDQALEMKNFNSKELNRTFETIYFVQGLSKEPNAASMPAPQAKAGKVASVKKEGLKIAPAEADLSIADLYAKADEYKGKTVKMKGEVVKVNNQVMGKNWIHIQDGSGSENNFDLTITTQDEVKVGDTVTFEGTVNTKKDFGYGYYYDVILEDAKLVK